MPYEHMTPKQKRIVENDTATLFSTRAFIDKLSFEEIARLDIFHPTIKYKRGTLFLSDKGVDALRRLTELISDAPDLRNCVSKNEVRRELLKEYNTLLAEHLQPTGQEFVERVGKALVSFIKDYEFLVQLEGLDIKDQAVVELGTVRIQRSDRVFFDQIRFEGGLGAASIYEQFKDGIWLVGGVKGSPDIAAELFDHRATLTVGILAVCGALLYKGAIWRSRVRAVTSPLEHRKAVLILMWERGGNNPSLTRKWGYEQDLLLDGKSLSKLIDKCLLKQLASLPDKSNPSEVEEAILRSTYWFADAYRDRNPTMQFVKLWSSAECFFAIDKDGVTNLNVEGFAAILTFAGFKIIDRQNYRDFKRRVEKLYDLRSQAVHRGIFGHIETSDLDDLSRWVAWIIVSMVSLSERGYRTLNQIRKETSRLDQSAGGGTDRAKTDSSASGH